MTRRGHRRKIEWNVLAVFVVLLLGWMYVGLPIMNDIASTNGAFISYGIYLLLIGIIGYVFGSGFSKGLYTRHCALLSPSKATVACWTMLVVFIRTQARFPVSVF